MRRLRISAISYLNTAPLMWELEHGGAGDNFEITYTVPSKCAAELQAGTADVGIIPSAAYVTNPALSILPGVAIASKQAVRSILLVSRKPMEQIRAVALDSSSITSVALARILFQNIWGGGREFTSQPPNLDSMLSANDAALLIGDPALKVDRTRYLTWDLSEEWMRFTGKPFVFAFWAVREQALRECTQDLASTLQQSRDNGLQPENLAIIVKTWSEKLGMQQEDIHRYLTTNICYYLDDDCLEGLQLFYRYALECRILPRVPELRFAECKPALT